MSAPRLFLASASPRRRELLGSLGVSFTVVTSRFDEDSLKHLTDPEEYTLAAAEGKAVEVAARRDGFILGVDTDVFAPDGAILGKPKDPEDAVQMLIALSGQTHTVYSGVALLQSSGGKITRQAGRVVETKVTFAPVGEEAIRAYVQTGEPMDKAGAYGIQGRAMSFIARIDGDLSNVIGLPLWTVGEMLAAFDYPLWKYESE